MSAVVSIARSVTLALIAVVVTSPAQAARSVDDCIRVQVRLSISTNGIAFTGGSYAVSVNLRNISGSECSVEGHPQVIVSPHSFPIVVGDLANFDRHDPNLGPERLILVRPGSSVHAQVVIGRRCVGAKSQMTRTTITFASYGRTASLEIPACRREGATIDTGPYLPPR
jgi:hypothetical protein